MRNAIRNVVTFARSGSATLSIVGLAALSAAGCLQDANGAESAPEATTTVRGELGGGLPLIGTKCWTLNPVLGKDTFLTLTFLPIGNGQSLFSGQAVRNDGTNPDRVLQVSGSASRHAFVGAGSATVDRFLLDLNYSFSKTGTDPAKAFAETGAFLRGHYAVRLNPQDFSGVFEGNDVVADWTPPLTGPAATYSASDSRTGYSTIANNYLGGINCNGSVPGFNNCGTVIPLNNAGTLTLVAQGGSACDAANPQP